MSPPRRYRGIQIAALSGIALWELLGRLAAVRTGLLPTPSRIALELYREWPRLAEDALTTICEVSGGLAAAAAAAIVLGGALGTRTKAGGAALSLAARVPAAPLIAFAPLFWIWFGTGVGAKLALAAFVAFFPLLAAVLRGYGAAPGELIDIARLAGAGPGRTLRLIRLPFGLPVFIKGLKAAAPLSMSGALAAELVAADRGLGYILLAASSTMDLPLLCAGIAVIVALGFAFHSGILLVERALLRK